MSGASSELPAAEMPFEGQGGSDTNERTKGRQALKWGLVALCIALPLGWYAWSTLKSPSVSAADDAAHVKATALIARGDPNDPRAQNEDLASQVRQLQGELTRTQAENVNLTGQVNTVTQQRDADRADAQRTIDALDRARAASNAAPVVASAPGLAIQGVPGGAASPSQGSAAPPLSSPSGPNPFAAVGSGAAADPTGRGAAPPPRRAMQVVRASTSGPAPTPAGPTLQTTATPTAATGAAAPAPGAAPAGANPGYFSGQLTTYDSGRYVPPNAYAPARVLVGVDAATGTSFSSDPKPVLLRITGPATHVGERGAYQTTRLEGCVVNGAAYGELASEKVYIKLQRITCPAGPGKFSVATVEGYVTSKGKAGVRGPVISREGSLTSRALVAGALNGLGQGLSQNLNSSVGGVNTTPDSIGGLLGTQRLSGEEIAQGAIGSGVSGAASMLAEYYIKRAEQYQPVIEMPTGVEVEIVFLSGFQIQ